jgi:hypothetical protein
MPQCTRHSTHFEYGPQLAACYLHPVSTPDVTINADREKAAALIARWLEGGITNWIFEDEWPELSDDRAVVDIGRALWSLYSDYPQRPLGLSNLSLDEVSLLERCLAFLRSCERYEPVPYAEALAWKPTFLTRLFRVNERPWETMQLNIHPERQKWWPFADEAQWRKVSPR